MYSGKNMVLVLIIPYYPTGINPVLFLDYWVFEQTQTTYHLNSQVKTPVQ